MHVICLAQESVEKYVLIIIIIIILLLSLGQWPTIDDESVPLPSAPLPTYTCEPFNPNVERMKMAGMKWVCVMGVKTEISVRDHCPD